MIIDTHTHVYPEAVAAKATENLGHFYDFTVDGKGTLADLTEKEKRAGIGGFFLLGVATTPHQVTKVNDAIAAAVTKAKEEGFFAVGFGGMHQNYPDFPGELSRMRALGLRGVKIHPDIQGVEIDSPLLFPLYEEMQGKMPVYLHVGDDRPECRFSEPRRILNILDNFPRLTVVAAHFGGYRVWDEGVQTLSGRENLWFDSSSSLWAMTPGHAVSLLRKLGTDRVFFGSDYPVTDPGDELKSFEKLPLTDREREDILSENARRFLG